MPRIDLTALNNSETTIIINEPRGKWILISLVSATFVAIGAFVLGDSGGMDTFMAWGSIGFFGLCLLVSMIKVFGKADYLMLDPSGFTYTTLGRVKRLEWHQLESFGVAKVGPAMGSTSLIAFNYVPTMRPRGSDLSQSIAGFDGALPTNYGVKAAILAEAMQQRLVASHSR